MKYLFFLFSLCFVFSCQKPTAKEVITPTGNIFTKHTAQNGQIPAAGEEVEFVVDIRIDTAILQSSRTSPVPAKFIIPGADQPAGQVSPLLEALQMMGIGDSATIKRSLDSFPQRPPGFEEAAFVSYDVVLKSIRSKEAVEADKQAALTKAEASKTREADVAAQTKGLMDKYLANGLGADLKTTESGLKYYVIEAGTGAQVTSGGLADVHYYGMTTDGKMFDNSFSRGAPYPVPVGRGQVIRGWDEGLVLLKEGAKAVLFIPGELGYGERGSPPNIGPNAELVFYVEIDNVQ